MQQYTWRSAASRARDRPPCLHARLEFASAACDRALRCFVYDTLAALRTTHGCIAGGLTQLFLADRIRKHGLRFV